jgi:hypothetical protein
MAGVAGEILDQEQVDKPEADIASAGCVLVSSSSKSTAITRERSLARSNAAITSASVSSSAATPAFAQRAKKPCTVFHERKSGGSARHLMPLSVT